MLNRFRFRTRMLISLLLVVLCTAIAVPAMAYDPATLYNGSTGEKVRAMQKTLIKLGYLQGDADGIFGNKTENAVRRFQWKNGLTADGLAGKRTLAALEAARSGKKAPAAEKAAASAAVPAAVRATRPAGVKDPSTLYNGCTGDAVLAMQQKLIDLGYLNGTADGKFGDSTEKAVRKFQSENGLKADGLAGKKTLAALKSAQRGADDDHAPDDVVEVFTVSSEPGADESKWDKMEKKAREILRNEGYSTSGLNYIYRFFSPKSENRSQDYYSLTFYPSSDTHEFNWIYAVHLSPNGKLLQLHARTDNSGKMEHNNDPTIEDADPNLLSQARAAAKAFLNKYGYSSYAGRVNSAELCQISVSPDGQQVEYHLFDTRQAFHVRVQVLPTVKVENFNEQ